MKVRHARLPVGQGWIRGAIGAAHYKQIKSVVWQFVAPKRHGALMALK